MAENKIKNAILLFEKSGARGEFIASDIFKLKELEHSFDLIICHDVVEHIEDKSLFLRNMRAYLKPQGFIFMSFPAWQMPFGGHQQICKGKIVSHLPFFHLLPAPMYKTMLKLAGEEQATVDELLSIKKTRTSIELFEKLCKREHINMVNRTLYFINPHYEVKFGLKPRKLFSYMGNFVYVRNYFTTSCFYMLKW